MPPIVLDISRTVSRVLRGHETGIDRVESAYIEHFITWPEPVFFLARFGNRSALLDRNGMRDLWNLVQNGGPWDGIGLVGKFRKKKRHDSTRIEQTIRRLSVSWPFLSKALNKHVPENFTYLNVGHGAMREQFWPKLHRSKVGRVGLLIHDVIPLSHPEFSSAPVRERYPEEIKTAVTAADFLIYNSQDTKNQTEHWLKKWALSDIESIVAPLGTNPLPYKRETNPTQHPFFVVLGTIEPRKNHILLLKIWQEFQQSLPAAEIPHLYIVGNRGWQNEDVFEILDNGEFMGKTVHEMNDISDSELGSLMANAQALLFPSFVEGFGYPLVEAMQMGTPVICSDIPIFHEISGKYPQFIKPNNAHEWRKKILERSTSSGNVVKNPILLPDWPHHFQNINIILGNN